MRLFKSSIIIKQFYSVKLPRAPICTAWVHGIHPQRLSFFEDKLYQLIEELGKEGIGGHEKVETEEENVFEKKGGNFETALDEIENGSCQAYIDESLSSDDFPFCWSPPELGRAVGRRGASKWWQAGRFFNDLEDYSIERKSAVNQEFWRKMEKWKFESKLAGENRSHFRFKPLSWDGRG